MDMERTETQSKNISILRNAMAFAASAVMFFNAHATDAKTLDEDQSHDPSLEKNQVDDFENLDVLEQNTDPILEELKAKKQALLDELSHYSEEEKAIIAEHQGIIDQAMEAADPYWKMEALLEIAKDNRFRGGNLRINTRGPMFTPANILKNTRAAMWGDDQRMLLALTMGADARYVKDKKLREKSLKTAKQLASRMEVWDELAEAKLGRADRVAEVALESRAEKNRRGYRTRGQSGAVSFARGQYRSQREIDRKNANLFFHANTTVFARLLDYSIDKAIVQENIIVREEHIIDDVKDQYRQIKQEINQEIGAVNSDMRARQKELRNAKKMGALDDDHRDQFNLSKMDMNDRTELAQNTLDDDYKENQEIVTGFEGVDEGNTFRVKRVFTKSDKSSPTA